MTGGIKEKDAGLPVSKEMHEKLSGHKRAELLFTEGMRLDIDGYLYEVARLAGPFTILKRLRPSDPKADEAPRVLKLNDKFNIRVGLVTHNFRVTSAIGRAKFRIRRIQERK